MWSNGRGKSQELKKKKKTFTFYHGEIASLLFEVFNGRVKFSHRSGDRGDEAIPLFAVGGQCVA